MFHLDPLSTTIGFAATVGFVGMPHGGLDHHFGRALLKPWFGRSWMVAFGTAYLLVAMIILACWQWIPVVALIVFFLLSAYHFGEEISGSVAKKLLFGGMPIWLPILVHPVEVSEILADMIPTWTSSRIVDYLMLTRPLFMVFCVLFVTVLFFEGSVESAIVPVLSAAAIILLPTLIGFTIYFCGIHSTRELAALSRRQNSTDPASGLIRVLFAAAPLSLAAVALTIIVTVFFSSQTELRPVLVQAVFLGLSAVAVPHMLLHAIVRRRRADPFPLSALGWTARFRRGVPA